MAKLTAQARHGLDTASFALPGRRYPIEDKAHARNALARAAQHASPAQQATVKAKVKSRYPSIEVGGKPKKFASGGPVALVSKGIEAIGRATNTERGRAMKAADAAIAQPKEDKAGGSSKRAEQINAAVEPPE